MLCGNSMSISLGRNAALQVALISDDYVKAFAAGMYFSYRVPEV